MAGANASGSDASSIHASAVLVGPRAVLIRGPSGSGKSRLAFALLQAAEERRLAFARLVSDDRTLIAVAHQRLLAKPVPELAGLIEVYGLGIRRVPYEPQAVVFLVVDLAADAPRMPDPASQVTTLEGISLPRLAVASGHDPMPLILSEVRRQAAS
jgi:HPr kinase/phosphorylase